MQDNNGNYPDPRGENPGELPAYGDVTKGTRFPMGPDAIADTLRQAELGKEQAVSDALTNALAPDGPPAPVNGRPWEPEDLVKKMQELSENLGPKPVPQVIDLDLEKAESLRQCVLLAIGAASLTFEEVHGVFDDAMALSIAFQLYQAIQAQVGELAYQLGEMKDVMPLDEFRQEWMRLMTGEAPVVEVSVSDEPQQYPQEAGEITLLGPDVFIYKDLSVICHKGANYYTDSEIQRRVNIHKAQISHSETRRMSTAAREHFEEDPDAN